jgi:hypothetical protein
MQFFWNTIQIIKTRNFSKKKNIIRIKIKNKFQRINLKKTVLKTKSTQILVKLKLQLNQSLLSNTPPLSNVLSLYGITPQQLCEDISNELKILEITDFIFLVDLFLYKDLSYKYNLKRFKLINLLKMFYVNHYFDNLKSSIKINFFKTKLLNFLSKRIIDNSINENLRNYYLSDLFFLSKFINFYQFFFLEYNFKMNKFNQLDELLNNFIIFEKIINNNLSLLKTLNINLKLLKIKN